MTCRECSEFLADYLSDDLPPEVRRIFERHLTLCPNCVTYLDQYRAVIDASRAACAGDQGTVEIDIPDDLVRAILAARNSAK